MDPSESELIKDSMILEYQHALADAHYKIAVLNGQAKVRDRTISRLEQSTTHEPTG